LSGLKLDRLYELNPGVNRWATDPEGPHRLLLPIAHAEPFAQALADLGERERVQWTRHQIRAGETLGQLAMKYQTTEAVLREINGLRGNMIRAGGYLMIPHATRTLEAYTQTVDARTARQQNRERDGERIAHVVKRGDSLWSIAGQYKTGVRELASWNAMAPGDTLSVGRELVIWSDAASAPATSSASASSASAAAAATLAAVPVQPELTIRRVNYTVRRGDSLSSIAQRFRVTVGDLVQWNSVSTNKYLQPGQRLVMYVDVTEQST
jgi:membrane-bound lytic murein transglycosylase D